MHLATVAQKVDAGTTALASLAVPVTTAVASGKWLVLFVSTNALSTQNGVFSATDTAGNVWTAQGSTLFKSGTLQMAVLTSPNTHGLTTSDVITVAHASANVLLWEVSVEAFDDVTAVDVFASNSGANVSPASGPTAAAAQASELLLVATACGASNTITAPAGWSDSGQQTAAGSSTRNMKVQWQYVNTGGTRAGSASLANSATWGQIVIALKSGQPPQVLVPVTDETVTSWTTTPSGTSPLYTLVDEGSVVDITDYVTSQNTPSGQVLEFLLGLLGGGTARQPTDLTAHKMHVMARLNGSAGSIVLKLKQGASTVLATSSALTMVPGSIQDYEFDLSSIQAALITDITQVRFHLEGTATP